MRFETDLKMRFNYTANTTEAKFNSLYCNVSLQEIYEQFLEIEQMEQIRIDLLSPHSKKKAKKAKKNRLDREKFAISKLLSPDRIAEKREMAREIDRVRKANRRTDPLERQRYNASQNAIYHQSTVQRNSNACVPAEIQDEYGGWEETKQNSPVRDDGTNSNKVQGVLMGFDNTANAVDWSNHGSDNLEVRTMLQDLQNNNGNENCS